MLSAMLVSQAPTGGHMPDAAEQAGDARVVLCAQGLANWRAEARTGDDGPAARTALQTLLAEGEQLLRESPSDRLRIDLLARLWRTELDELERTGAATARLQRLAQLGDLALAALVDRERQDGKLGAGGPQERDQATRAEVDRRSIRLAMAQAAARAIAPGELRRSIATRITPASASSTADGGGDTPRELLELTVAAALQNNDIAFVNRLGNDAVPALLALAWQPRMLENRSSAPDPLVLLARRSPSDALDIAQRLVAERGAIGRARVLSAFAIENPFANASVWASAEGTEILELRQPNWANLPQSILAVDAERVRDVDPWIREFVERNHAPAAIAVLLPGWIARGNKPSSPVPDVVVGAAKQLLASGEAAGATLAATEVLLRSNDLRPLWAIAEPSKELRAALVPAFGLPRDRTAKADEAYADALQRFVCSNPDTLAGDALHEAAELAQQLGCAVLGRRQLEACIAKLRGRSQEDQPRWIAALAAHAAWLDEGDRNAMFGAIARHASPRPEARTLLQSARRVDREEGLRAAFACLLATASASQATARDVDTAYSALAAELAACWNEAYETSQPVGPVTQQLSQQLLDRGSAEALHIFAVAPPEPRREPAAHAFLPTLPEAMRIQLLRKLCIAGKPSSTTFDTDSVPLAPARWLDIAANTPTLPAESAEWLIRQLASAEGPRLKPTDAPLLARAMVCAGSSVLHGAQVEALGVPTDGLLRALLAMRSVEADAVLASCSIAIDDPQLLEPLLQRLPPSGWAKARECWLHRFLLQQLAARNDRQLHDAMLAANLPGSTLQLFLIETLEKNRAAVHLPVAGALLRSELFRTSELRTRAVELVASYRSDEAAQFLLQASREWTDPKHRELLKQAFDRLVAWRESEQRWLRGTGASERRARAVAELVQQLDGNSQDAKAIGKRVRALQALAALKASEELPRISALCDDASPAVQAAARQAFERLLQQQRPGR
ncbi:MAG: hypothetical protein AB8H80_11820 [Planctomycetota bacterium]